MSGMGSSIPESARTAVKVRDHFRCARCLTPAPIGHWHHRRSRLVADAHQHCPCNGVWLCRTCHDWVHHHPVEARETGWMISKFVTNPATIRMHTPLGLRAVDCKGGSTYDSEGSEG